MTIFKCILLGFLIVCAIAASLSKRLLNTILIFMSYSLIMSIIWVLLESPDLAITEAAVGAGVTTVLFLVTLKKINAILKEEEASQEEPMYEALIRKAAAEEVQEKRQAARKGAKADE